MRLSEITEALSGDRKALLVSFMSRTAADAFRQVTDTGFSYSNSFAKRLVGNLLANIWFLRNLVGHGKDKTLKRKLRHLVGQQVAGALRATLVDHPFDMQADPAAFVDAFLERLIQRRAELARIL